MLDDEIEIKVIEIQADRVKIGINAPKSCRIVRKELCLTVENNREAAERSVSARELLSAFGSSQDE